MSSLQKKVWYFTLNVNRNIHQVEAAQGWRRIVYKSFRNRRQSSAERRKTLKSGREVVFSESADRLLCVLLQPESVCVHGGQIMAVGEAYIIMRLQPHTPGSSRHYRIHADSIRPLRRAAQIPARLLHSLGTRARAHLHNNFINN